MDPEVQDRNNKSANPENLQAASGSLAVSSAVIFLVGTAIALFQYTRPFYWHHPRAPFTSWAWYWNPLEWNIDSALPDVPRDIHGVAQSRNGKCLWIAGANAFLAYSSDAGNSWIELQYELATDGKSANFHAPNAQPFLCGETPAQTKTIWPWSPSIVYAATQSSKAAPGAVRIPPNAQVQNQSPKQSAKGDAPPSQPSVKPLEIEPAQLFFGSVQIGKNSTRALALSNLSDQMLQIREPYFEENFGKQDSVEKIAPFKFFPEWTCSTLEPHGRCVVQIMFRPTVVRQSSWTLVLQAESDRYKVLLSGEAFEAPVTNVPNGNAANAAKGDASPAKLKSPEVKPPTPPSSDTPKSGAPDVSKSRLTPIPPSSPDLVSISIQDVRFASIFASDGSNSQVGIPTRSIFKTADSGKSWIWYALRESDLPKVPSWGFLAGSLAWRINLGSRIESSDSGKGWSEISRLPTNVVSIFASDIGSELWVAGSGGVIFHSRDGGHSWSPLTRSAAAAMSGHFPTSYTSSKFYGRFLAPWYFALIAYCVLIIRPAFREQLARKDKDKDKSEEFERGADRAASPNALRVEKSRIPPQRGRPPADEAIIGTQGVSDKPLEPGEPDALELGKIAAGLSFFLRNKKTKPPLVIGINGRWGSGKSSLMNLLKKKLEAGGAHPVWFNAWHHQKEEQLLAALLQAVKQQAVPPLFALHGLHFRWNLFWKRLQRYWLYVGAAAAIWFLIWQAENFLRTHLQPPLTIWTLLNNVINVDIADWGDPVGPLSSIAGLVAIYHLLSRLLTAFGSSPEALLSSVSGATKKKDREAQTSFRLRFAREFEEVTKALPPSQRMLILVDDLDRCRPEKVREVFEAINFLVSSGDCFVVLGMARDIVEHYVGLSFRSVVDGLSWEALGLTDEDKEYAYQEVTNATAGPNLPKRRRSDDQDVMARRFAFARLYLDKLVQIQVTVPEPTPAQKRLLFETEETRKQAESKEERRFQALLSLIGSFTRVAQPIFQVAVVAAMIVAIGYGVSRYFGPKALSLNERISSARQKKADDNKAEEAQKKDTAQSMKQIANGLSQIATNMGPAGGRKAGPLANAADENNARGSQLGLQEPLPQNGNTAQNGTTPASAQTNPKAPITGANVSQQTGWIGTWPFLVLLVAAAGVFTVVLRTIPQQNAQDSQKFTSALTAWSPLVMTSGAKNTPRAAKRFQNRVRYLAMRQRALSLGESPSLGERWLRNQMRVPLPAFEVLEKIEAELSEDNYAEIEQAREHTEKGIEWESFSWRLIPGSLPVKIREEYPLEPRQFAACVSGRIHIPETMLVAFAAIEAYEPSSIRDLGRFLSISNPNGAKSEEDYPTLQQCQSASGWSEWPNLLLYRFAYLRLCSEVSDDRRQRCLGASGKEESFRAHA